MLFHGLAHAELAGHLRQPLGTVKSWRRAAASNACGAAWNWRLGTLAGRARRRFERLLVRDPALRTPVAAWERRFGPLYDAFPAVPPPKRVWREIERRLTPSARQPFWQRLAFWRPAALMAGLAAVFLAYTQLAPPASAPAYVAMLSDKQMQPAWMLRTQDRDRIEITALNAPPAQ